MNKTRIGIPTALLAAIVCLLGYYGSYEVAVIVTGYVLLVEESAALKRLAAKVLVLLLTFSLVNTVIYLIPSILSWVQSLIYVFDVEGYIEELHDNGFARFLDFVSSSLGMLKKVLFLVMSAFALLGKELKIPGLDKVLDKYLEK